VQTPSSLSREKGDKPRVIALMGPTASGKTALAMALHEVIGAEIISVDSAMVYRGMDIGSAKPSAEELVRAPHRLIDIRDPSETYSAAEFCRDAALEIKTIVDDGKIPLLVGGTMMYFKALLAGLSDMPASEPEVRAHIESEAAHKGWPAMHGELTRLDPDTAALIHPNHSQRISRALEVFRISGKTMSEWRQQSGDGLQAQYAWQQIALAPHDRSILHQRIKRRFATMLEEGLVEEVEGLFRRDDLHPDLPALRAVGYRQVWAYLEGTLGFDEMREKGEAATRQLAKRQLTWLRSWPKLAWLDTQTNDHASLSCDEIVDKALSFLA